MRVFLPKTVKYFMNGFSLTNSSKNKIKEINIIPYNRKFNDGGHLYHPGAPKAIRMTKSRKDRENTQA